IANIGPTVRLYELLLSRNFIRNLFSVSDSIFLIISEQICHAESSSPEIVTTIL
ncbi:hypothetical protein L9F63_005633, partial [Diploptera punctata]